MSGHLFVTRGDLTQLACDAILVPSGNHNGRTGHLTGNWSTLGLLRNGSLYVQPAPDNDKRAVLVRPADRVRPAVWVGHTGDAGPLDAAWYVQAVIEFIRAAATVQTTNARPLADPRPVLAVPLIGTGAGGIGRHKGLLVRQLVDSVQSVLTEVEADVVIVAANAPAYSALQQARILSPQPTWSAVSHLTDVANVLARQARRRRLVLFMGAGTGIGAGLPSWGELLESLSEAAEMSDAEKQQLATLDPRDAGEVLHLRLGPEGLADAITARVSSDRVSLVHQLLASLPVDEAVTTNYDQLFERAWDAAGRRYTVLPRETARDTSTWLLKLHGSIDERQRIVLSRDDYLRFEGEGVALAGVVQAMLLTRHILFVGYSLSDDNFHRLVHQVRAAIGPRSDGDSDPFGTALSPSPPHLVETVWKHDIQFVNTCLDEPIGVRRMSILLDLIGREASAPAAHVEDVSYDDVFTRDELDLRTAIMQLRTAAAASDVRGPVREAAIEALRTLGGTGNQDDANPSGG
jgi:hypothetical protein